MSKARLSDEQQSALQGAILQLSQLEKKIDRANEMGQPPASWARDNAILSKHVENVTEILMVLKSAGSSV